MKRELVRNLSANLPDGSILEGTFTSRIFRNENSAEMLIYLSSLDYAEDCITHFNSMPDDMVDEICLRILKNLQFNGADFDLAEFENVRDILNYCCFTTMVVDTSKNDGISYTVEGEGDWGEAVGFVIKNGNVSYVGFDYEDYL
ncbi:MAG: hypothetical protein NC177_01765 [Ruminococcus flavefaciens]|nr:hypothetical protein [Ruminococcus flavefaciens]